MKTLIKEINNVNFVDFLSIDATYTIVEKNNATNTGNEIILFNKKDSIECPGINNTGSSCFEKGEHSISCLSEIKQCYNGTYNNSSF